MTIFEIIRLAIILAVIVGIARFITSLFSYIGNNILLHFRLKEFYERMEAQKKEEKQNI